MAAADTEQARPSRLLVVPEEVEGKDASDGADQFDPDVMEKYKAQLSS